MINCAFSAVLAADAEQRTSKSGKTWVRLRVAVGDGEDRTWLSVSCFGAVADDAAKFVKGDVVSIEGTIRLSKWTGQDGVEKTELAVVARYLRRAEIGRNRPKAETTKGNHVAGKTYHSPRSAPAGRLPAAGNDFHDDEIPW